MQAVSLPAAVSAFKRPVCLAVDPFINAEKGVVEFLPLEKDYINEIRSGQPFPIKKLNSLGRNLSAMCRVRNGSRWDQEYFILPLLFVFDFPNYD